MARLMTGKLKVAVLISGRGSNLQALLDACAEPGFPAEIVRVISNVADAYGLERARRAGVATEVIDHRGFAGREAFDAALDSAIGAAGAQLVCLAGFMRLLTPGFSETWSGRLINIHPSLLPCFKGLHTHRRALDAGVKIHGCTVHFVTPDLDDGPIFGPGRRPGSRFGRRGQPRRPCSESRTPHLSACPEADRRRPGDDRRPDSATGAGDGGAGRSAQSAGVRRRHRHIGGLTPSLPITTRDVAKLPSGALTAGVKTARPGFSAERSAGTIVTIGALGGTRIFMLPPL